MGFLILDNYPAFVLGWCYRNNMIVFGSSLSERKQIYAYKITLCDKFKYHS